MYAIKLNDSFVDSNMNTWYEIKHGALCPEMSTQNKEKNLKSKSFQISFARISKMLMHQNLWQKACVEAKRTVNENEHETEPRCSCSNNKPNLDSIGLYQSKMQFSKNVKIWSFWNILISQKPSLVTKIEAKNFKTNTRKKHVSTLLLLINE